MYYTEWSKSEREKQILIEESKVNIYIYMESRKMVLLSQFAGPQCRHKYREQMTYGHGRGGTERMGGMETVTWKHIHYHM